MEPLKDGVRAVVAGPPNSGKSSLVNAIAGSERAIVTDIPGTTRDHIEVPLALGGIPLVLTDTAGLRESSEPVERIGVERSHGLIAAADILLWLGEPDQAPPHLRLVKVHAKCELPDRAERPAGSFPVSAVTGSGLAPLLEQVRALAVSLLPAEDAIALNRRQAEHLADAHEALARVPRADDIVTVAEDLRLVRNAFDRLTGRASVEMFWMRYFRGFALENSRFT